MMDRQAVDSSHLVSVGYDEDTNTLEVEFKGGVVYQYEDVPEEVHKQLIHSSSVGGSFQVLVKDAGYRYTRVS